MAVSVIIGSAMLILLGPYSATVDSPLPGALMFNMYISTMKNMVAAQATEIMKIAEVSGSVVVVWPPR